MSANTNMNFFDNVDTNKTPSSEKLSQPWTAFHKADESLMDQKTLIVDVPLSEENGGKLGRVTRTGSLGGTGTRTAA